MDGKKKFALIGVGGYIAVRHLHAIKEVGGNLLASLDPNDSVGIIDSFFPQADFFVEFERFDRHIDKLRRQGQQINYVSICSPNYLHDSHIRFALRSGADAICEKPLVLNPWNIDALKEIEEETGNKVNNVLQLRLHPSIQALKEQVAKADKDKVFDIDLTYITGRGNWYKISWKGDHEKSGGIATNIGVHFFDMLSWVFGPLKENIVHLAQHDTAAGYLEYDKARVRWFLSLDEETIPDVLRKQGKRTYRSIQMDGQEIEFSDGFTDLHTRVYEETMKGKGFGLEEARTSIETVYAIRNAQPLGLQGDYHPFLNNKE